MSEVLYDPFKTMRFGAETCFLCGTNITPEQNVPVFPNWLQKKYNLAAANLKLLDQNIVAYSEKKIPACKACATKIEEIETAVASASEIGLKGWESLEPETLFKWFGKIFYGILITELKTELNPLIK